MIYLSERARNIFQLRCGQRLPIGRAGIVRKKALHISGLDGAWSACFSWFGFGRAGLWVLRVGILTWTSRDNLTVRYTCWVGSLKELFIDSRLRRDRTDNDVCSQKDETMNKRDASRHHQKASPNPQEHPTEGNPPARYSTQAPKSDDEKDLSLSPRYAIRASSSFLESHSPPP